MSTTPQPASAGDGRVSFLSASTLLAPATIFVATGLIVPLAILFRYSLNQFDPRRMMIDAFSIENYVKFFTDPFYTNILGTTLRVSAICTVICLLMGLPLAYVLARTQSRYKNILIDPATASQHSASLHAAPRTG